MEISRSNYEIVFIDYFDGKLDKESQEKLFTFLKANPDLQDEFDRYSGINLEPDLSISFEGKDRLKKDTITLFNYKTWLVAYIENDLTTAQKKEVDYFLSKNTSLKTELEILKQTKLVPDRTIIFNKKNLLRKGGRVIYFTPAVKRALSVAAALLIFALSYYFLHHENTPQSMIVNNQENVSKENKVSAEKEQSPVQITPGNSNTSEQVKKNTPVVKNKKPVNKNFQPPANYFASNIPDPEAPEENACDDYHPPVNYTQTFADNPSDKSNNKKEKSRFQGMSLDEIKIAQANISEIFDKDDLKELEKIEKKKLENTQSATTSLLDLAANKLHEISKATDISIEKKNDPSDKMVTYALEVGKHFSISHTTEKN